ncbi:MAG: ABC transporter permease, partial [Anaerolineae bacterium]
MIKTRMRKILRDVIARKGRTFLVSLAIFIGVAGTITLFSMSDIIVKQLEEDIQEDKLSMLQIFTTTATSQEPNNDADYAAISNFEGLTAVIAANQSNFYFKQDPDDDDFQDALLTGYYQPLDSLPLEPMRLVEGNWPTPDAKQLVVEKRMGEEFGIKVGDTLTLRVLGEAVENGAETVENWTVSGIVFHPYAQAPDTAAYALLPDVERIGGITGFNAFLARFENFEMAQDQSLPYRTAIAQNTPYRAVFTQEVDPARNPLIEGARQIGQLLGTIAIMALLVSGFLVVNVITSIVVEQKRLIGVMKSLGATRADNFMMYSGLAFMYGIIGVIPGVIVGIIGGQVAANLLGPELNTVISGFNVSLGSVIIGVVIGLLVPVIASLLPVFNGTRVTILEAMTDLGIAASNARNKIKFEMDMRWYEMVLFVIFLPLILLLIVGGILFTFFVYIPIFLMMAAILWVLQRIPMPLNLRHGINSVAVKKRRLVLTVFTLALAVGAFMGIFSIFSSISEGLNSYLDTFNVQIFVLPSPGQDTNKIEEALAAYPEIDAAEPGAQLQIEFEDFDWE